jgi:hypothetical protein
MRQAQEFCHVPILDVSELVDGTPSQWAFRSDYLLNKVGKVFPELR